MALPTEITTEDLSTLLGINARTVAKLVERNVLRRLERGTFATVDSIAAYVAHRESIVAAQHGVGEYGKARAELYLERGRIARMQREEMEGTLGPLAECRAAFVVAFGMVRSQNYAMANRAAPRLVGLKSAAVIRAILVEEINAMMADIQSHCDGIRWIDDGKAKPKKAARP